MQRRSPRRWLVWPLILLPFALYAVNVPRFGALQRNDYWGDFRQLLDGDRLTHDPVRWLRARSNEHRIALPLLLWTANIHLTRGDNRALALVSLALLLATFACLWRLLPASIRGSPAASLGFGLPLAMLIATPVAAHCWIMGFSGNQWYLANLSAAAGIACFARLRPAGSWRDLLPALLLTLPGAFAHSTHLALWPALLAGALFAQVPRKTVALTAAAATAFAGLFLWGYSVPRSHPVPGGEPGSLAGFFATYLSLRASNEVATARLWGAAGIALFGLAIWVVARRPRAARGSLAPWLLVAIYAALNALGTSLARVGFGPSMALSSRYASLPALFWLGTLATLGVAAWERPAGRRRSLALAMVAVAAAAFLGATTATGLRLFRQHLKGAERQPLGALAMVWNVADAEAIRSISFSPHQTRVSRAFFARLGHIPFDRAADWPLGRPWSAAAADVEDGDGVTGRWRVAEAKLPGFLAVSGNATSAAGPAERVLFLDAEHVVRGGAVFIPRPEAHLPPLLWRRGPVSAWFGYLEARCAPGVRAYVEIDAGGTRRLVPLRAAAPVKRALAALCAAPTPRP